MTNNSKQKKNQALGDGLRPPVSFSLADRILERIESEKVTPTAKWRHSGKNMLFWLVWIFTVLIGSIAFAASLFTIFNAGWRYYSATHDSFFRFFIESLPFMWLLVLGIFLIIGLENIKHTNRGYKYSISFILFCSIVGSVIFGSTLYAFGLGQLFDEAIGSRVPFHQTVIQHQQKMWVKPDQGLLAGEFNDKLMPGTDFNFTALDGTDWSIITSELTAVDFENISKYSKVRLVGITEDTETGKEFTACFILPWDLQDAKKQVMRDRPLSMQHRKDCLKEELKEECETKLAEARSSKCKDLRPYDTLRKQRN